ncbi:MAG: hypothetical protein AB8B62_19800 [Roseobacter sp.]
MKPRSFGGIEDMSDDVNSNQSEQLTPNEVSKTSSYGADFDKKISEARAKRAEVLSAREMVRNAHPQKVDKTVMFGSTRHNKLRQNKPVHTTDPETPWVKLTGANAVRAVLVFAGAAGFGLGVVLGVGVLLGVGIPASNGAGGDQVAHADVAPLELQPEVVELDLDAPKSEASYFAEATPESEFDAILVSYDMLDMNMPEAPLLLGEDLTLILEPVATVSLPTFSSVSYMRGDIEHEDAVELRTIPAVDAMAEQIALAVAEAPQQAQFFMHAPDGLTDAQLRRYISQIEASGVEVAEVGRESFRVSTTHLRYYSPQTAEVAMEVAQEMGVEARDFSQNVSNNARIEVWVAGRPVEDDTSKQTSRGFFSWLSEDRRDQR